NVPDSSDDVVEEDKHEVFITIANGINDLVCYYEKRSGVENDSGGKSGDSKQHRNGMKPIKDEKNNVGNQVIIKRKNNMRNVDEMEDQNAVDQGVGAYNHENCCSNGVGIGKYN
ncbi:11371_t:CDS:2, partial [Racocetra persica]